MGALISELKIMVYLGKQNSHLNVVNLLGAVTKNITKRKNNFNSLVYKSFQLKTIFFVHTFR